MRVKWTAFLFWQVFPWSDRALTVLQFMEQMEETAAKAREPETRIMPRAPPGAVARAQMVELSSWFIFLIHGIQDIAQLLYVGFSGSPAGDESTEGMVIVDWFPSLEGNGLLQVLHLRCGENDELLVGG